MMKIGIDISLLCVAKTGIGQYKYNLIDALSRVEDVSLYLYGYNYRWNHLFNDLKFDEKVVLDVKKIPNRGISLWWNYFSLPLLEQTIQRCDCYHISETSYQPSKSPYVATIHDLTVEKFPELHRKENIFFASRRHKMIAESGMPIIAVSEQTKLDFVEHYGIDPSRITVVYHGKNEMYRPIDDEKAGIDILSKYGISEPYILYLGTVEPRKNIARLVAAFYELKQSQKLRHKLVLAGANGWDYEAVFEQIRGLKLEDEVKYLGFVEEEEKPLLINGADLFAYVSIYEGFGLPVLEAMSCGVPVLTSRVSAIPEVTGEASAVLVDPMKIEEIAAAMWKMLSDRDFAGNVAAAGLKRAQDFSWDKCARETAELYKKLIYRE